LLPAYLRSALLQYSAFPEADEEEFMTKLSRLARLGVYGFDPAEPVILAALVTEDPLLLIGPSGTGKTFLLNTLSEALELEHRHYNASLISFDDLVGFPYPDKHNEGVKFLQTPATVWGAESVLIDEISRCKPEHQNRLFRSCTNGEFRASPYQSCASAGPP
jgi:MoxR-like ATPase